MEQKLLEKRSAFCRNVLSEADGFVSFSLSNGEILNIAILHTAVQSLFNRSHSVVHAPLCAQYLKLV